MAQTNPEPTSTLDPIADSTPLSDPKIANDVRLPASAFVAHQQLFLIIFICLANKGVVPFEESAQLLEDAISAMPDLPQGAQISLRAIVSALWNFHKDTSPERVIIH